MVENPILVITFRAGWFRSHHIFISEAFVQCVHDLIDESDVNLISPGTPDEVWIGIFGESEDSLILTLPCAIGTCSFFLVERFESILMEQTEVIANV